MSAYMKICSAFEKLSLHQRSNLKTQFLFLQSATPQVEFNRGRRRSSHPPNWFVAKKNKSLFYENKELLPENKDFLQEVIRDSYHKQLDSPLRDEPWERHPWTFKTKRTGVLAIKIGAIPQWKKDGTKFFTTMLQVVDNHVIKFSPPEVFQTSTGFKPHWKQYGSVVVGALSAEPLVFTKDYCSIFKEAGVPPKRKLTRFLVTPDAAIQPGTPLFATHFKVGDYVDVQAKTIGHGFQGVVKRWGFKGGPATHGSTKFHRRTGSIGSGRQGARVKKGKKMPGHMGMDWRHLRGLKIWRINTKYNVIYVNGPMTPGPMHCYVRVFDTALRHRRREMLEHPPYNPTFYQDQDADGELPEEILHKDLYQLDEPSIIYEEAKS